MNPLQYILVPLGALAGLGFLLVGQYGEQWVWLIAVPVVLMAGTLSVGPQLKWWYWQRYAPDLPTSAAPLLRFSSFYHRLDTTEQREFRRRAFLWREAMTFVGKAIEKIPDDVQLMVAMAAASVSFYRADFLLDDFKTIVLYQHDFPTPQNKELHASELYVPDGALIFNMPTLVRSTVEPQAFLSTALYEFGHAYREVYPDVTFPTLDWQQIQSISGFRREAILEYLGWEEVDPAAVGLVLYFTHTQSFIEQFPDIYSAYSKALNPSEIAMEV